MAESDYAKKFRDLIEPAVKNKEKAESLERANERMAKASASFRKGRKEKDVNHRFLKSLSKLSKEDLRRHPSSYVSKLKKTDMSDKPYLFGTAIASLNKFAESSSKNAHFSELNYAIETLSELGRYAPTTKRKVLKSITKYLDNKADPRFIDQELVEKYLNTPFAKAKNSK
jgi:hypothetical protein